MYKGIALISQDRCKEKAIKNVDLLEEYYIPIVLPLSVPLGEKIFEGDVLCNKDPLIHCPVTGIAQEIQNHYGQDYLVLKTDMLAPRKEYILNDPFHLSPEEIIEKIRLAGIVGLGGEGLPAYLKLQEAKGNIDTIIINALESEPFLSAGHRLLLEKSKEILQMAQILKSILGAGKVVITFTKNKALRTSVEQYIYGKSIEILEQADFYPNGYEKFVVQSVTQKELKKNDSTLEVACLVHNVSTIFAMYEAVFYDKPLTEKVITVDGAYCLEYGNFFIKMGTPWTVFLRPFSEESTYVMFQGGPMRGKSLKHEKSITKTMNGIMIFEEQFDIKEQECINCAACVDFCPVRLEPYKLIDFVRHEEYDKAKDHYIEECILCNICSCVCPSFIPIGDIILQNINKEGDSEAI